MRGCWGTEYVIVSMFLYEASQRTCREKLSVCDGGGKRVGQTDIKGRRLRQNALLVCQSLVSVAFCLLAHRLAEVTIVANLF